METDSPVQDSSDSEQHRGEKEGTVPGTSKALHVGEPGLTPTHGPQSGPEASTKPGTPLKHCQEWLPPKKRLHKKQPNENRLEYLEESVLGTKRRRSPMSSAQSTCRG